MKPGPSHGMSRRNQAKSAISPLLPGAMTRCIRFSFRLEAVVSADVYKTLAADEQRKSGALRAPCCFPS
jgi:hypothetical protein